MRAALGNFHVGGLYASRSSWGRPSPRSSERMDSARMRWLASEKKGSGLSVRTSTVDVVLIKSFVMQLADSIVYSGDKRKGMYFRLVDGKSEAEKEAMFLEVQHDA